MFAFPVAWPLGFYLPSSDLSHSPRSAPCMDESTRTLPGSSRNVPAAQHPFPFLPRVCGRHVPSWKLYTQALLQVALSSGHCGSSRLSYGFQSTGYGFSGNVLFSWHRDYAFFCICLDFLSDSQSRNKPLNECLVNEYLPCAGHSSWLWRQHSDHTQTPALVVHTL